MASKTRTVRFESNEAARIDAFLAENQFLDFSTLTRLALAEFIQNPKLTIKPISKAHSTKQNRKRGSVSGGIHG